MVSSWQHVEETLWGWSRTSCHIHMYNRPRSSWVQIPSFTNTWKWIVVLNNFKVPKDRSSWPIWIWHLLNFFWKDFWGCWSTQHLVQCIVNREWFDLSTFDLKIETLNSKWSSLPHVKSKTQIFYFSHVDIGIVYHFQTFDQMIQGFVHRVLENLRHRVCQFHRLIIFFGMCKTTLDLPPKKHVWERNTQLANMGPPLVTHEDNSLSSNKWKPWSDM